MLSKRSSSAVDTFLAFRHLVRVFFFLSLFPFGTLSITTLCSMLSPFVILSFDTLRMEESFTDPN